VCSGLGKIGSPWTTNEPVSTTRDNFGPLNKPMCHPDLTYRSTLRYSIKNASKTDSCRLGSAAFRKHRAKKTTPERLKTCGSISRPLSDSALERRNHSYSSVCNEGYSFHKKTLPDHLYVIADQRICCLYLKH
jgi:hypothetical protein